MGLAIVSVFIFLIALGAYLTVLSVKEEKKEEQKNKDLKTHQHA